MTYLFIITLLLLIAFIIYYAVNKKKIQQHIEKVYLEENRQEILKQLQTEKQFVEDELLLASRRLEEERERIDALIKKGTDDIRFLEQKKETLERHLDEKREEQEKFLLLNRQRIESEITAYQEVETHKAQIAIRQVQQEKETSALLFEQKKREQEQWLVDNKQQQLQAIEDVVAERKARVDADVEAYRELETQKARTALDTETQARRAQEEATLKQFLDGLAQCKQEVEAELERVKAELADYKQKQQVINEAILRQRAIEEKQDFYRVCLSENTIDDIKLLQEIRQKLHNSESLNKLIYDVYVSKAVAEMVKRVLNGSAPSGIYKITRIKTGEIYIGKSTNIKDRWTQHCKTVYGAGTIAHSILHTTMQRDGLEQFTFEVIEEVPKEKLTEREKYWIEFYGSKEYGMNEKNG